MNLASNPSHIYSILIIFVCILNELCGTRIPLEIVQLGSDARLNDGNIANTEYQVHEIDEPIVVTSNHNNNNNHNQRSKNATSKSDDWFSRMFHLNNKATTSARDAPEPRIIYQVGVCIFIFLYKCSNTLRWMEEIFYFPILQLIYAMYAMCVYVCVCV